MSKLTPQEEDFGVVYDYLPAEGHPQDVEEKKCPYCALRRIRARIAELEAGLSKAEELCKSSQHALGISIARAERAEAALAELTARRCETCQRAYTDCSRRIVLINDDTVDVDFCSEWTARAEEGSGDE